MIARNIGKWWIVITDGLVKSKFLPVFVIPAKAGIHSMLNLLDSRLRGNDKLVDLLRGHHG
jgi:hypothetical protein